MDTANVPTAPPIVVPKIEVTSVEDDEKVSSPSGSTIKDKQHPHPQPQTPKCKFILPRCSSSPNPPPINPNFQLLMPKPTSIDLLARHCKSLLLGLGEHAFSDNLHVYPATTFSTFRRNIRAKVLAHQSLAEVECARDRVVKMKMKMTLNERKTPVHVKDTVIKAETWEAVREAILEGRGTNLEVEYCVK